MKIQNSARVFWGEACIAISVVRNAKNWPSVLLATFRRRFHQSGPERVFELRTRRNVVLQCPNTAAYHPIYEIVISDVYQLRAIRWMEPPQSVLDIGAHVGAFTCALAVDLPNATYTCVEPSDSTLHWLEHNLALNGLSNQTRVIGAAVASKDGEAILFEQGEASSVSSLYDSVGS